MPRPVEQDVPETPVEMYQDSEVGVLVLDEPGRTGRYVTCEHPADLTEWA